MRYGDLPDQVADVRWPTGGGADPAPLVLVVHGGFWRAAYDRHHTADQCAGLAAAGYAVAAVEYRRTGQPGGGWPGTFEDVGAAVDDVPGLVAGAASAAGVAVDTGRTVLMGHSAGGHLVAWAVTSTRPRVVGAVSLAGVLDLDAAWRLGLSPGPEGPAVAALLGGGPQDVPDRYAAADPTRLGVPTVPVQVLHGTEDESVPLALGRSYAEATGQPLQVLPGVEHFGLIDPTSVAWPAVLEALRRAARPGGR